MYTFLTQLALFNDTEKDEVREISLTHTHKLYIAE